MRKKWNIKTHKENEAKFLAKELGISEILAGILLHRGIADVEKARTYLHPQDIEYYDPFLLPDMSLAVNRILSAIDNQEPIAIYGDYDADGITATTILMRTLRKLSATVSYYIPDRFSEGYGVNLAALEKLAAQGNKLVITVDCGIKSVEEIQAISDKMDVIVTDHHLPGEVLPAAVAVVNAHRLDSQYPCVELAGVGIAFKLCQALCQTLQQESAIPGLEIVALGTVADAVPLVDENRKIVADGLRAMQNTQYIGLQALIEGTGLSNKEITAVSIGFVLAPRINAAGRLKKASISVDLLLAEDWTVANQLTNELIEINNDRREYKDEIQKMAEAQLASQDIANSGVIVVAGEGWHHGVLGLVASTLQEKYYRPTIVISTQAGVGKGSCRSIPGFNLFEALSNCSQELIQFGGHEMAAGLTVEEGKIDSLRQALEAEARRQLTPEQYIPVYDIDMEVAPGNMTMEQVEELALLEPCGMKNESPLFAYKKAQVVNPAVIGMDNRHLKFTITSGASKVDAIAFNQAEYYEQLAQGSTNVVYEAVINQWRDRRSVQCMIKSLETPVQEPCSVEINREFMKNLYLALRSHANQGMSLNSDISWLAMQLSLTGFSSQIQALQKGVTVFLELKILEKAGDRLLFHGDTGPLKLEDSPSYCLWHGLEG